jgi:hypothetical protein
MIAALVCVVLLASLTPFIFYCRSALTWAGGEDLSDHVLEVVGTASAGITAGDFDRFLQLVRLCPEHVPSRSQIRAVAAYYDLLCILERACRKLTPSVSCWAEMQRQRCSHFAAVVLDGSIASSRTLFSQHAGDNL